jgi:hypothetical protein
MLFWLGLSKEKSFMVGMLETMYSVSSGVELKTKVRGLDWVELEVALTLCWWLTGEDRRDPKLLNLLQMEVKDADNMESAKVAGPGVGPRDRIVSVEQPSLFILNTWHFRCSE